MGCGSKTGGIELGRTIIYLLRISELRIHCALLSLLRSTPGQTFSMSPFPIDGAGGERHSNS